MDAWFSYLLSVFYVFLIASFFGYMAKLYPQRNIFEISREILGNGPALCQSIYFVSFLADRHSGYLLHFEI